MLDAGGGGGSTDLESFSHEQLIAVIKTADPAELQSTGRALNDAKEPLSTIADDIKTFAMGIEWEGPAAENFREWALKLSSVTREIADYADRSGSAMVDAGVALIAAKRDIEPIPPGEKAIVDSNGALTGGASLDLAAMPKEQMVAEAKRRLEVARQKAVATMQTLGSHYKVATDTQVNMMEPTFPALPDLPPRGSYNPGGGLGNTPVWGGGYPADGLPPRQEQLGLDDRASASDKEFYDRMLRERNGGDTGGTPGQIPGSPPATNNPAGTDLAGDGPLTGVPGGGHGNTATLPPPGPGSPSGGGGGGAPAPGGGFPGFPRPGMPGMPGAPGGGQPGFPGGGKGNGGLRPGPGLSGGGGGGNTGPLPGRNGSPGGTTGVTGGRTGLPGGQGAGGGTTGGAPGRRAGGGLTGERGGIVGGGAPRGGMGGTGGMNGMTGATSGAGGQRSAAPLAGERGGVVGGSAMRGGSGGAMGATGGATGSRRAPMGGERGGIVGGSAMRGAVGSRREEERRERADYLQEDEETWRGGGRPPVTPVID